MKRPIRAAIVVLTAVVALVLASAAFGQVEKKESVNAAVTGDIIAIDAGAGTITVKGANDDGGIFMVNDMTTIMSGDEKIKLKDLKTGWHIVVDADQKGDAFVATYIEVVDGGS